jgi:hypothetical protein
VIDTPFCLDTSFLINGWWKRYRRDVFPTLWDKIDELLYAGNAFSCREVFDDLKKQRDALFVWARQRKEFFYEPGDEVIANMKQIMARYPNFAAESGHTNASDPWVIAEAMARGAIVVTDEVSAPNQRISKPPKIPDVCNALNVGWASPIDFLAAAEIRL